jgi:autonomous glycyl radical cofactor GrcA
MFQHTFNASGGIIMKKILRYLLMTVMAICFSIPCFGAAEAASVALLPLINNVQGGDELANQVFYKNAMAVLNSKKGFVMVENDKLTAAIDAAKVGAKVPSEAAMAKIAKDGDVDIVIAIELDKLDDKVIDSSEERKLQLDLQGYAVAYNRLTGKAYQHRIYSDKTIPEALSSRWDWTHEEFGRTVRVEIDRALRAK